jgi:SAM-dependent methyltransferase
MKKIPEWIAAQVTEKDFWDGMIRDDHAILRVLADNAEKAPLIRRSLPHTPQSALEVGAGPFGLGVIGFLPEIPHRFALDPLAPVGLGSSAVDEDPLRHYIRIKRRAIQYAIGYGEEIPVQTASVDLVLCCNVIDHTSDPDAILREVHRVLKTGGLFYFDVHTFSVLGLLKWHTYTKHAHKDEILVRAHPYRMYEASVIRQLRKSGFAIQKLYGHTVVSNAIGHARASSFLGTKCSP